MRKMHTSSDGSLLFKFAAGGDAFGFGDGDGGAGGDGGEAVELAAGPANFDGVGFVAVAEAEGEDEFAGGKRAGAAAQHFGVRVTPRVKLQDGTDSGPIRLGANQLDARAVIRRGGA